MATTTNYSWTTPDDTALVKNGAAAIRSLGTAIDTTVFNNANAAIAKTLIDAKGDLIVGSAADTAARLAVGGTNGHVLTVNSGATNGIEWAAAASGSMTLLSTTSLSGSSVTLSNISGSYKDLILRFIDYKKSDDAATLTMQVNADTGSNYNSGGYGFYGSTVAALYVQGVTTFIVLSRWTPDDATNDFFQEVKITDYSNSTTYKMVESKNIAIQNDSVNNQGFSYMSGLFFGSTSAITEVKTSLTTGTFTGGSVLLYGVN